MVSCKHCATPNSLDSTFCKKCGTPLPEEEMKLAAEKLEALVAEGVGLFNAGKTEEAMDVATTAVEFNPSSISALALKGDCHAHRGEVAEAIECYEHIVSLNPESTLDKIRLNQLRNSLVLGTKSSEPDRRIALVGAFAAVVLVVSVTAMIARARSVSAAQQEVVATAKEPESPAQRAQFYDPAADQPQKATTPPQTQTQPPVNQEQPQQQPSAPDPAPSRKLPSFSGGGELPAPNESIGSNDIVIKPVSPDVTGNIGASRQSNAQPTPKKGTDPDPTVDQPPANNAGMAVTQPPADDPGEIQIEVRRGGGKPLPGGSTSVGNGTMGAEALTRVARQQYQLGNYQGAAGAYEKALGSGGDPISINQRLGQAYERLGRKGDATAAYQRAISSADAAMTAGRGDKDRLQALKDSCQQALRVLQGN